MRQIIDLTRCPRLIAYEVAMNAPKRAPVMIMMRANTTTNAVMLGSELLCAAVRRGIPRRSRFPDARPG